ncbi:MAG TPA: 5'-nucleotidase, lipoprotein e(P4) family [Bacteroidales bacterium]|nr:5'-nucleotidase, lipoprotein e(P4) family [Bacteroidales bacterium]
MKNLVLILTGILFFNSSCTVNKQKQDNAQDHLIMSVLWYQKSAEMKALYYQGFNIAQLRMDFYIANDTSSKPNAVIVDIDETMLDNSPFEAKCIETGLPYTKESWNKWTNHAQAEALPGAVEFSNYAKSKNVEVFYISNRSVQEFEPTLKNLKEKSFAYADSLHLLLKTTTSNKEERRMVVQDKYDIVLLIGDNLGDFAEIFDDRSENNGFDHVIHFKNQFGERFIVLPNPMYGSWEAPILNFQRDISETEKYNLRKAALKGF